MDTPTSVKLNIISARRPIISAIGARAIAPTIIPAKAKLNIHPSKSGVRFNSDATGEATTAMAVISNPSSILKIKHKATTRIC